MIRFLKILLCFSALCLNSTEWHDDWTQGVLNCDKKNYKEAERNFTKAIKDLENKKDDTHPHIYVDRARLYLLTECYNEALSDVDKAMQSEHLINQDLSRAVLTRLTAHSKLKMDSEASADLELYKKVTPNIPKFELYPDKIIVRNLPESPCAIKMIKSFLLASYCENEVDIQILPSGICIAKRKACNCGVSTLDKAPKSGYGEGCKWWCDKGSLAGFTWCGLNFRTKGCQVACIGAVELLKDGCNWCCNNKGFYQNCIKPFEDILAAMGNQCDPAWD